MRGESLSGDSCISNGYGPAMTVFTKIYKVPFSHLGKLGHKSVDTYVSCLNNIKNTIKILRELAFVIHPEESVLTSPSNCVSRVLSFHLKT